MEIVGKVLECRGNKAVVLIHRPSACGENCAMCKGGCVPTSHRAVVRNALGARPGDMVRVTLPDGVVLRSALLVYIVPLILMFAVYGIAFTIFHSEATAIAAAFAGLAAGVLLLRLIDKKYIHLAEIDKVIDR